MRLKKSAWRIWSGAFGSPGILVTTERKCESPEHWTPYRQTATERFLACLAVNEKSDTGQEAFLASTYLHIYHQSAYCGVV
jgi:hypothetical protein